VWGYYLRRTSSWPCHILRRMEPPKNLPEHFFTSLPESSRAFLHAWFSKKRLLGLQGGGPREVLPGRPFSRKRGPLDFVAPILHAPVSPRCLEQVALLRSCSPNRSVRRWGALEAVWGLGGGLKPQCNRGGNRFHSGFYEKTKARGMLYRSNKGE